MDTTDKTAYRVEEGADLEARRLEYLGAMFDPASTALLERLVRPGDHVLEVGVGGGSIARWLADRVGPDGRVLATDIDLQFAGEPPANLELREHDITVDPLPEASFDLARARGVLQHLDRREDALERMVAATKPGGWVVAEDADFWTFESQAIPEPLATVCRTLQDAYTEMSGHDRYLGRRLVPFLRGAGLVDVDAEGHVFAMHGGQPSAEWYFLGIARAGPALVSAGLFDEDTLTRALTQARDPDFAALSPIAVAAWGRKPA
ncbi:MAG: methyltransferase domain-containing protein [Actinobacteria bacterium]|nr:methyltransferase domain-containing protein [Actinomycetota bacterium]